VGPRSGSAGRAAVTVLAAALVAFAPKPTPTPVVRAAPLEGTPWSLAALGTDTATAGSASLILRASDGKKRIGGTTACGRFLGAYDLFAGRLRIFPAGAPDAACAEAALEQRKRFLDALKRTANYRIAETELVLLAADGTVVACFAARPGP
jgi:heat shock protein HslJ